jgi:hypothetical protein
MASASSGSGRGRRGYFDTVSAGATDSALVAAVAGQKIRVVSGLVSCGATPSSVQFTSKGAGAGTACGPVIANSIVLPEQRSGWFETNVGEGLSVTTGAGSATGIQVSVERVTPH